MITETVLRNLHYKLYYDAMDENDGTIILQQSLDQLAEWEQHDFARWRHWHEEGTAVLSHQLRVGNLAVEPNFLQVVERLGNRLLLDDPDAFVGLVTAVQDVPIQTQAGRQLIRYFGGVALGLRDQYEEAVAVFDGLLAEPGLDEVVYGRALNSRALYCRVTGRLQEAISGYQQSLDVWQRLGNRLREGLARLNLGIVAYQLQQFDQAEAELKQAQQCFEETRAGQWVAAVQSGLGLIYRDRGQWTAAMICFDAVAARRRADEASDSLGRVLVNISETYLMQGRLDEAIEAAQAALLNLETQLYRMNAYLALGLARQVRGDLVAAQEDFQAALGLAQTIKRQDTVAEVHMRLGDVLHRLGDDEAALTQFLAGVAVIETTRTPLHDEGVKISLLGRWQQVYEALVLHCVAMGRTAEAFLWAEKARARAFVEVLGDCSGLESDGLQSGELASVPTGTVLLSYFTTGVLDRELPWVQQLAVDSALRDHLLPPARVLLFALTAVGLTVQICDLNPNDLVWRGPRQEDRQRYLETAVRRYLHDVLLPASLLVGASRVLIAPHGPLHELPFAALLPEQPSPLLTLVPTVSFWQQRRPRPAPQYSSLCLALAYDGGNEGWALRHTEAEARFIAELTGGAVWAGAQPKVMALAEQGHGFRWLHVACHGRFDQQSPLDSYLQTGADERLTARQVLADWHLPVELVVLSACQTGVSQVQRGDEPMGLVRAFLTAGAGAVLVSQWAVADWPTFLLMRHFYQGMMAGEAAAAALQAAQQWLQRATVGELKGMLPNLPDGGEEVPFAHPRYWAAFVLVEG